MSSVTANYHNSAMNDIWNELAEGYFNLGYTDPNVDLDKTTLKDANDNMVKFIINKLQISEDSYILDMGCGMGMYTVQIAARTGCQYIGTDINEAYLKKAELLAQQHGVADKGKFLYASFGSTPEEIKKEAYTHVISLGAIYHAHPILKEILLDMAECCRGPSTKVFIWDFVRTAPDIGRANIHLKLPHVLATKEEVMECMKSSPLELISYEDLTQFIIPGYKIIVKECAKKDPEMKFLTFDYSREAFETGKLAYLVYYCKLR